MRVIDLSHFITPDMPMYPGSRPPLLTSAAGLDGQGFVETEISLLSHTGTHVDAPAHILANGAGLDEFPAGHFVGPGLVVDLTGHSGGLVEKADLAGLARDLGDRDFVLLHTGWSRYWGYKEYFENYPVLSPEAAGWLAGFNLKGLGLDAISVDHPASEKYEVHRILLGAGLILLENLTNLDLLPARGFTLVCLPLKIKNADGSPVRAAAMVDE